MKNSPSQGWFLDDFSGSWGVPSKVLLACCQQGVPHGVGSRPVEFWDKGEMHQVKCAKSWGGKVGWKFSRFRIVDGWWSTFLQQIDGSNVAHMVPRCPKPSLQPSKLLKPWMGGLPQILWCPWVSLLRPNPASGTFWVRLSATQKNCRPARTSVFPSPDSGYGSNCLSNAMIEILYWRYTRLIVMKSQMSSLNSKRNCSSLNPHFL